MAQTRDWQGMKTMSARLLQERTGEDMDTWNHRIQQARINDAKHLRAWLAEHGVTEYWSGHSRASLGLTAIRLCRIFREWSLLRRPFLPS